jgi:hypothetical protein
VTIHAFFYTISTILNPSSRKQGGKTSIKRKKKKKKKLKGKRKSMHGCKVISIVLGFDINLVTYS